MKEKLEREKEFHNEWARSIKLEELMVRETFEAPTAIENHYALKELGDLKGRKVLDHDLDQIADAFIRFAKEQGFSFWR